KLELAELQSASPLPLPAWLSAVPSHLREAFSFLFSAPPPVALHGVSARRPVDRRRSSLHPRPSHVSVSSRPSAHLLQSVPSSLRVALRAGFQASPVSPSAVVLQSYALFPGRACPLMVSAAAPTRLQPAPANSLSVN